MLTQSGDHVMVRGVLPDSPAARAGLNVGDLLLTVDGVLVKSPDDVVRSFRGRSNAPMVLTVKRTGTERTVTVSRAP